VFREAALLDDLEMLARVTRLNQQIIPLAPALNSPTLRDAATMQLENPDVPVATMVKPSGGATYLFATGMRDGATKAAFTLAGAEGNNAVQVLGENRTLTARNGSFSDHFDSWTVHLCPLPAPSKPLALPPAKK
jgi:hypothetical protein